MHMAANADLFSVSRQQSDGLLQRLRWGHRLVDAARESCAEWRGRNGTDNTDLQVNIFPRHAHVSADTHAECCVALLAASSAQPW